MADPYRTMIVSLTDWHVPFHDPKALASALAFCRTAQPEIIIIHECHDFYPLSRFDKDPKRIATLQQELDDAGLYLAQLRRENQNARIILLDSNHLDRLRRYVWAHATALDGLRCLKAANLLELDKHGIEFMEVFVFRGFLFKHGSLVRKHSGATAKAEYEKEGMSGASGHTHRLGQYYTTKRGGEYTWIESGCLCDLHPEYVDGQADWQQGLSVVRFRGDSDRYIATMMPIIGGKL